jgi:hypothetical protein
MALGATVVLTGEQPAGLPGASPDSNRIRTLLYQGAPLIVLVVIYSYFALTTQINIGHRHLLPVYAPMLILAGGAAGLLRGASRAGRVLVVLLIGWFIAESLVIRPNYLAYFNSIAGGPANGYRHLVDSNLDVGQDLIALRKWIEADTAARGKPEPVFLSFFGPADPVAHGLTATRFGDTGFDQPNRRLPALVHGGLYCISVTLFQGLYTLTSGPWTGDEETFYQGLLRVAHARSLTYLEARYLEHLQFARLRHYLAHREPTARVGYSILIFRLRDEEVDFALYAPLANVDRELARQAGH